MVVVVVAAAPSMSSKLPMTSTMQRTAYGDWQHTFILSYDSWSDSLGFVIAWGMTV